MRRRSNCNRRSRSALPSPTRRRLSHSRADRDALLGRISFGSSFAARRPITESESEQFRERERGGESWRRRRLIRRSSWWRTGGGGRLDADAQGPAGEERRLRGYGRHPRALGLATAKLG